MSSSRRRRLLDVLRRTSDGDAHEEARGALPGLDDAGLWNAHEQATQSLGQSGTLAERVAASVARHRALVDAVGERASLVAARAGGLGASTARVAEAFERLGVVALNAGLEGSRVAEPQSRALMLVSEEIRASVARGSEAAREVATVAQEVGDEAAELRRQLDRSRNEVAEVGQEAARLRSSAQQAQAALEELGQRLRKATGVDPEVARAVALASDHARGLLAALSTLAAAPQARTVLAALRPLMSPLSRMLGELGEEGSARRGGASAAGREGDPP